MAGERIGVFLTHHLLKHFFLFCQVFVNHKVTALQFSSCTKSSPTRCIQPAGWAREQGSHRVSCIWREILAIIFSFSVIKQYLIFSLVDFEMSRIVSRLWPVSSIHKSQALKNGKEFTFFPRALHRKDISKNNAGRIRKSGNRTFLLPKQLLLKLKTLCTVCH